MNTACFDLEYFKKHPVSVGEALSGRNQAVRSSQGSDIQTWIDIFYLQFGYSCRGFSLVMSKDKLLFSQSTIYPNNFVYRACTALGCEWLVRWVRCLPCYKKWMKSRVY